MKKIEIGDIVVININKISKADIYTYSIKEISDKEFKVVAINNTLSFPCNLEGTAVSFKEYELIIIKNT